ARLSSVDDFDDVEIPFIRKLMVESAHNVQFRGAVAFGLRSPFQNLLVAHDIPLRALQVRAESAENAAVNADVGGVDVRIDIVIAEVAVLPLANEVGQLTKCEQIVALEKEH